MKETFPRKVGRSDLPDREDALSGGHVNDLSDVCRRVGNMRAGPRIVMRQGRSWLSLSTPPERPLGIFEVYNTQIDASDAVDSGLYLVRVHRWLRTPENWSRDDSGRVWPLDASGMGLNELRAGDKLVCWWDDQRGALVPTSPPMTVAVIKFQVNQATGVEHTDATFSIDNVTVLSPPGATEWPGGGSEPTAVNNLLGVPANDDAEGIGIHNPGSGLWEGLVAPRLTDCPEESSQSSLSSQSS